MKTLTNKLIDFGKKAVLGASIVGLVSFAGINYAKAEEKEKSMVDITAEAIEEETPLGIPIKILKSIFGSETNVYIQQPEKTTYQKRNELPLVFLCFGVDRVNKRYMQVGTQILFPGQDKYYIVGKREIFQMGNEVTNYTRCLTTEEEWDPVKKRNIGADNMCKFGANAKREYGKERGYHTTLWKNTWYVDGKEVGSVTYAVVDKEMIKRQRLRSGGKNPMNEITNQEKLSHEQKAGVESIEIPNNKDKGIEQGESPMEETGSTQNNLPGGEETSKISKHYKYKNVQEWLDYKKSFD